MDIENAWCRQCPVKKYCSPYLMPERIRHDGTLDTSGKLTNNPYSCRHSTCPEGKNVAMLAMKQPPKSYTVCDYFGVPDKIINAVSFETPESKPTKEGEYRIVDVDTGQIFSKQDGIYYPTGQWA